MSITTTKILKTMAFPFKVGDRQFPTTEHYVLASLLKDRFPQDVLLSYPVEKIQTLFQFYDQEQYRRVVYDACNVFHEKKCKSVQHKDNKTIGSQMRKMIRSHEDFLYKTQMTVPFHSVVGLNEVENVLYGYNLVGHSLQRMKFLLEKVPEFQDPITEYIFWRTRQDIPPLTSPLTYKQIVPKKNNKVVVPREAEDDADAPYVYEEMEEEDVEEQGYYPEEVPVFRDNRVRWIATSANARLDDLRDMGARADFLYTTEATPTDPFASSSSNLYSRTDPLYIFKIYKAAEHLVGLMKNGFDIQAYMNKPVDAILWECKVSPELFDPKTLRPTQRHAIYVEHWHKFMHKTIPYYALIEKEILYPQNLAGFIRKEYAHELNENIGRKIKEILFSSFVYQVIEKSYPQVAPELKVIVMAREMKNFTVEEYEEITNSLYHLFFQKKFHLDEEGTRRLMLHESYRLSPEQLENALHFIPCKIMSAPALDIHQTILDPMTEVNLLMDQHVFHDLFQYIFYRLFMFYGGLSSMDAYQLLFHEGEMMNGKDRRLPELLKGLVEEQRKFFLTQAILATHQQHASVQELILYAHAMDLPFTKELSPWKGIKPTPHDLQLMKWVVSSIPKKKKHHEERSIQFYFFLQDVVRSMGILKSMIGKRLDEDMLQTFFHCFYHPLERIQSSLKVVKRTPPEFVRLMEKTNVLKGATAVQQLWRMLYPYLYLFQQDKFDPPTLLQEAKNGYPHTSQEDMIRALSRVVGCFYEDQLVPNDHFYLITQMISGKDDIPMWPDPSFELVREVEEENGGPARLADLPEKIRKKIPVRKTKKPQMELVKLDVLHALMEPHRKLLREAFGANASRASFAVAALDKETIHPRRIRFYL